MTASDFRTRTPFGADPEWPPASVGRNPKPVSDNRHAEPAPDANDDADGCGSSDRSIGSLVAQASPAESTRRTAA